MNGGTFMRSIIISINQQHVDKILQGIKKFEYRTKVAKKDIDSLIIYCTFPTKKIVAKVKIKSIISGTPDEVWTKTSSFSGISREFFDQYFNKRSTAFAYELGEVQVFDEPLDLISFVITSAPQSFVYYNVSWLTIQFF